MESLTPGQTLLEHLKNYTNSFWLDKSPVSYDELKSSINAVAADRRCAILAKQFESCNTILHKAAREDDIDVFRLVIDSVPIESKFDLLKAQDADGDTALHCMRHSKLTNNIQHVLAGLSQENVTKLLQIQNREKNRLLHEASWADTSAVLEYLLSFVQPKDKFKRLKVKNRNGWTPLYFSVFVGNDSENKVRCILDALSPEECVHLIQIKTSRKDTVLHCPLHSLDMLKILLELKNMSQECKARLLQTQDSNGNTLLHKACGYDLLETVEYILDGQPLHVRLQLLKIANYHREIPLHVAAARRGTKLFQRLLASIPPSEVAVLLSMQDEKGNTAVTCAVNRSCNDVVQAITELIPTGHVQTILNIPNNENKTAMQIAVAKNNQSAVSILQKCMERVKRHSTEGSAFVPFPMFSEPNDKPETKLPEPSDSTVTVTSRHSNSHLLPSFSQPNAASESTQLLYPSAHKPLPRAVDLSYPAVSMVENVPTFSSGYLQQSTTTADFHHLSPMLLHTHTNPPHTSLASTSQFLQHPSGRPDEQPWGTAFEAYTANDTSAEQLSGPPQDGTYEVMATSTSTTLHQFLPDVLDPFNTDGSHHPSGSKRPAPPEPSTQPASEVKSARVDQAPGKVKGQTLRIMHQSSGYILPFKPENTVEQLTKRIEKATASSCTLKDQEGFQYTEDITLDLLESPFVISLDGVAVFVTGDTEKRNVVSSSNQTETGQSSTNQQKTFDRVKTVEEVANFLSFVREQMKKGKSVNGALKLAKKNRKTIDSFVNIYYLHGQNRERLEELEGNWTAEDKPGGLQGLDAMAKKEINWDQLQQLFANGTVADFRLKRERLDHINQFVRFWRPLEIFRER